ncbi:MAG: GNAT family N-acetyltransferase [Bacillus sp. (in: firmicutes)]
MKETQMLDLLRLQDYCESFDNIELKLNWEILKSRDAEEEMDFFHYEEGHLVGFLGIYYFGEEYEICGMVHPKFRRRGIFLHLFQKALATIPQEGRILINAPRNSQSAKKWLEQCACEYAFSEYQMKWHADRLVATEGSKVTLRSAEERDIPFVMEVDEEGFGFQQPDTVIFRASVLGDDDHHTSIIENQSEPVGKIQVLRMQEDSYIYGFAIMPDHQGHGYGKSALLQTVQMENKRGQDIYLEVALHNQYALSMYEQCGFVPYQTQDYYAYNG